MQKELQNQIFDTFSFYSDLCRNNGIQCGNGWFYILNELNWKLLYFKQKNPNVDIQIQKVSELFGGLKINSNIADPSLLKYINEAEEESYKTCEICGRPGKVQSRCGWLITLCERCDGTDSCLKNVGEF